MNVAIAVESRFIRTPDGAVWSFGWLDGTFWERYLDVFDGVKVIARVTDASEPPPTAKRADAKQVFYAGFPYYVGPWQYAAGYFRLKGAARRVVGENEALILRVPGAIGSLLGKVAVARGRPFAVEVVGDPQNVFTDGVRSIVAPIARTVATRSLRRECQHACAVAYVSAQSLSARYPPNPTAFVTEYSSIDLRDEAFAHNPKSFQDRPNPLKMVHVGSFQQLYKAQDVLILALKAATDTLAREHPDATAPTLTFVGDGKHRAELEGLTRQTGLEQQVRFAGHLPAGGAVRRELDQADLFVMPSRTEGLPRAMIEAMARGLPCLGTKVGGIPELLEPQQLVEANDVEGLAETIAKLAVDPAELSRLSAANFEKAKEYHATILQPRRVAFQEVLRDRMCDWARSRPSDHP